MADDAVAAQAAADEGAPVAPDEPNTDGLTLDAIQAELKRARREAASYRTKLRDAEAAQAEREKGKLSDLERLQAELNETKQALAETQRLAQERLVRNAVLAAAARVGFNDPDDAMRLIDQGTLEVREDGSVDGVEKAIQAIAKSKPYLVRGKPQPAVAPTNPEGQAQRPTDEQMRRELFGQRTGGFWSGGGVVTPTEK